MGGKICKGIICESVGGKKFFGAKIVIDVSGTAVVMNRAGVPTIVGENFMSYVAQGFDMEGAEKLAEDKNVCDFRNG